MGPQTHNPLTLPGSSRTSPSSRPTPRPARRHVEDAAQADALLRDLAFVLHATRSIKQAMTATCEAAR